MFILSFKSVLNLPYGWETGSKPGGGKIVKKIMKIKSLQEIENLDWVKM